MASTEMTTFSDAELALDRPAPKLGEHQDEVLR
jgi:crotonobetainyl-CoA:carnitine CoA-transferase CaiB-like acyl-CoA transferase